ncbi:MAG: hypothetical protein KBD63_07085 [Bacteriovoracaceae bacterium]|nr:hypothetical protein [Bacteriovoracaceae bacterium]
MRSLLFVFIITFVPALVFAQPENCKSMNGVQASIGKYGEYKSSVGKNLNKRTLRGLYNSKKVTLDQKNCSYFLEEDEIIVLHSDSPIASVGHIVCAKPNSSDLIETSQKLIVLSPLSKSDLNDSTLKNNIAVFQPNKMLPASDAAQVSNTRIYCELYNDSNDENPLFALTFKTPKIEAIVEANAENSSKAKNKKDPTTKETVKTSKDTVKETTGLINETGKLRKGLGGLFKKK